MKSINKTLVLLMVMIAAFGLVLAGCASRPKTPVQETELLDWKGSGLGTPKPQWVIAAQESNDKVQELPEYKDQYCFVVDREDANKDMATLWVSNTANGANAVSVMLSTTVNNSAEASEGMKKDDAAMKAHVQEVRDAMNNASFKGLRKAADFWTLSKNIATGNQYYTAYSLWVIPKKDLNDQMAANYQNIIDNNKALSEAEREIYMDIIKDIRARGLASITK